MVVQAFALTQVQVRVEAMDRCFTRSTVAAATLSGAALERHYVEVLHRTRPFRGHKVHSVHIHAGSRRRGSCTMAMVMLNNGDGQADLH